jgi:hypothetical protein
MLLLSLLACTSTPEVTDSPDPTVDDPAPDAVAADLFDPDVLHELVVTLDPADWAALRVQARSYYDLLGEGCFEGPWESPYTWFEADVSFDGEALGRVGVRKKGLIGSLSEERPSLRVDTDHVFDPEAAESGGADARFHGLEKLVFNNGNQDPSRLRTCLAHALFADAGLVAPRCSLAHVVVNGEDLGVYAHTEAIDEALVERVTGAEPVAMYEGALSDFRDDWVVTFEAETDTSTGAELTAVTAALDSDDDALLPALDAVLDLDAFFVFWAAESLAGHWDGYNGNTNNFYAYTAEDGRLRFIASGPDAAFDRLAPFGDDQPVWVATASALANRLSQHEEGRERFEAALTALLDTTWDEGARLARVDAWKDLLQGVSTRDQRTAIADLRDIVAAREGDIRDHLGERFAPTDLRAVPCWTSIGTVHVDFTTEWGSYPDGDVLGAGTTVAAYDIDGTVYPTTADGTTIGWAGDGTAILLTISTIAPATYLAPYVVFRPEALVRGEDLPVDGALVSSQLLYNTPDTNGTWQTAAWLGFGDVRFDALSVTTGGRVSGTLDVAVLGSRE